jgi:O-antigen ligase
VTAGAIPSSSEWSDRRWTFKPTRLLLVALLLFAIGNIGRIPLLDLGDRAAPILINELAVGGFLLAGALAMGNARSLKLNDVALAAIVFAGIGALSAVAAAPKFGLSWFEVIASLAYLARWVFYFCIYVVVINCLRAEHVETTWQTLERTMLFMCVFGIFQAAFLPDFALMFKSVQWDKQGNRLVSTILDPNIMAGLIDVVLLIQLARMAFGVRVALWKPVILLTALLLTLSRGGIVAFAVGASIILAVRRPTKRMAKLAAIIGVALAFASPALIQFASKFARFSINDASAMARVGAWIKALGAFAESPWFGIGFNTYGFVQEHRGIERSGANTYSADGGLLFVMVMTGLIGLSVFLTMLWFVIRRCKWGWKQMSGSPEERGLFLGVAAATVAVVLQSIVVNTLFVPFMMELLWVTWGLAFVAHQAVRGRVGP